MMTDDMEIKRRGWFDPAGRMGLIAAALVALGLILGGFLMGDGPVPCASTHE